MKSNPYTPLTRAQRVLTEHTLAAHEGHKHRTCAECLDGIDQINAAIDMLNETQVKALVKAYEKRDMVIKTKVMPS